MQCLWSIKLKRMLWLKSRGLRWYQDVYQLFIIMFIVYTVIHLINRVIRSPFINMFDCFHVTFTLIFDMDPAFFAIGILEMYNIVFIYYCHLYTSYDTLFWQQYEEFYRFATIGHSTMKDRHLTKVQRAVAKSKLRLRVDKTRLMKLLECTLPDHFNHEIFLLVASRFQSKTFTNLTRIDLYNILMTIKLVDLSSWLGYSLYLIVARSTMVYLNYRLVHFSMSHPEHLTYLGVYCISTFAAYFLFDIFFAICTVGMLTCFILCYSFRLSVLENNRQLASINQYNFKFSQRGLRVRFNRFRREYVWQVRYIHLADRETFGPMFTITFYFNFPMNIVLIHLLFYGQMELFVVILRVLVILSQYFVVILPTCTIVHTTKPVHATGSTEFVPLQTRIHREDIRTQLAALFTYERVHTKKVEAISLGPICKVTSKAVFEATVLYLAYVTISYRFIAEVLLRIASV